MDDTVSMTKINFEETFEIYLFTEPNLENNFSKLSEFISFLKYNKVNPPYKFSYVSRGDGFIPELTINENILMDFSADSLTAAREFQFQEFLGAQPNRDLENLYKKITLPHELPADSDAQMRKVASLIKSLIFEGQFIFLEVPELDLDPETLTLFISAMKEHIARNKQNVFIFSNNLKLWLPHVHQLVTREKNYRFSTEKIANNWQWKKERQQFFKNSTPTPLKSDLLFKFPKNLPKKYVRKKSAA